MDRTVMPIGEVGKGKVVLLKQISADHHDAFPTFVIDSSRPDQYCDLANHTWTELS